MGITQNVAFSDWLLSLAMSLKNDPCNLALDDLFIFVHQIIFEGLDRGILSNFTTVFL